MAPVSKFFISIVRRGIIIALAAAQQEISSIQAKILFYQPKQRVVCLLTMHVAHFSTPPYRTVSEAHDNLCKDTLLPFLAAEKLPQLHITAPTKIAPHSPACDDTKRLTQQLHTIMEREANYAKSHYSVYHALQGDISIVHDVYRSIFAWEQQQPLTHFFPLRFWRTALQTTPHPLEHAKALKLTFENYATNAIRSRPTLLSVNFALYGSYQLKLNGECTIDYWISNKSMTSAHIRTQLIEEVFDFYGFDKKYLEQLTTAEVGGCLLQILIPKDKIDTMLYLSHAQGIPFVSQATPTPSVFLERILQGDTEVAEAAQGVQGRLVLAQDYALNPSVIKIFRERRSKDDTAYAKQEQRVRNCMAPVFREWHSRAKQGTLLPAIIERVKEMPLYRAAKLQSA